MKILGIGNAIVDVLCKVSDEFLTQHSLTKSTMKLIDEVEFKKLHREFFDQYLMKAGAKEMLMNQESSGSWMNFQVDVIFEDWSGKNAWNDFFNT